ncbi:MAG: polyphosphate kinase 2 [Cytophagales bacterium]
MMNEKKQKVKLDKNDLKLLNSGQGLKTLFSKEEIDLVSSLKKLKELKQIESLRIELVKVQDWIRKNNKKVIVIFEGRDAAGKGSVIKGLTAFINPRHYKTVALPKPSKDQQGEWYFKRYVEKLPRPGEIVFFDRSWYNRAVVEPVHGFCSKEDYDIFMGQVNEFERMLFESENIIFKIFLKISKEEQARRLMEINSNPLKKWRMTPVDSKAQDLWNEYSKYENAMFERTDTKIAPWTILDGEIRNQALISSLEHIVDKIPYKDEDL